MPTLHVTNFNIVVSLLGGWFAVYGLVSYLCKENLYLSEALISLLAGVGFSSRAANFIRPSEYAISEKDVEATTLAFSRLVLGVQLVIAGVELPKKYLRREWAPLLILVGLVMSLMWMTTSLLVWAMVPRLPFLHALAVGSCVTPTDPVLSNVILRGGFADHNVPKDLQHLIIAESGTNDGLGYPFLFFALYLIKYTGGASSSGHDGASTAMISWLAETWGYTIALGIVYGVAAGWIAKVLLRWAEEREYVDTESFLFFPIALGSFVLGTCGMIGSDDILACFIAGNVFTWDDWFRLRTLNDTLQPTVDMLLNVSIFMWFGAVCPWDKFLQTDVIPVHRLILLGALVLLLRRVPWVLATHKLIYQIPNVGQAFFVGFFGPIGVSAIFYLYILIEFIDRSLVEGDQVREDVRDLGQVATIVVWFLVISSIVVHGLIIPAGKFGCFLAQRIPSRRETAVGKLPDREAADSTLTSLPRPEFSTRTWAIGGSESTKPDSSERMPLLGGSPQSPELAAESVRGASAV